MQANKMQAVLSICHLVRQFKIPCTMDFSSLSACRLWQDGTTIAQQGRYAAAMQPIADCQVFCSVRERSWICAGLGVFRV